ncbi:MAG: serine--tRNA ligase, partial [Chitinophagia bacterium]|nr:serine--tRNA ligase [Chitinophagia bacterium]
MLQLGFIRSNREKVLQGLQKKHFQDLQLVDEIITLDDQRKKLQTQSDDLLSQRNSASKSIGALIAQGKKEEAEESKLKVASLKEQIDTLTTELSKVEEQ